MALLHAVISEERRCRPSISGSQAQEKNLEPAQKWKILIQSDGTYTCRSNKTINRIIWVL